MAGRREQIQTWGEGFQDTLIEALEAEWAKVAPSDDPAVLSRGDKKAGRSGPSPARAAAC